MKQIILTSLLAMHLFSAAAQNPNDRKVNQILTRIYVQDLERSINFYENILGTQCSLRFEYKETGLELAQVGNILILSGSEKALEPFKGTKATFIVHSIESIKKLFIGKRS